MQITSHAFLLLFLPATIIVYYYFFKQSRRKMFFLLFASYLFYALAGWRFLPVLFGLSLATYWLALRGQIGWGVFLNLFILGLFMRTSTALCRLSGWKGTQNFWK